MKIALHAIALAALVAVPAARADQGQHGGGGHAWGYEGANGPRHWGGACKSGKQQSPINIQTRRAKGKELPRIAFQWKKTTGKVVNNGHTIQVNVTPGSSIDVGGQKYSLAQFHFHTPSEHAIDGKLAPLEVHFVHKDAADKLAVVGYLIRTGGAAHRALQPVFSAMKGAKAEATNSISVDLPAILTRSKLYYTYPGSLTTPPCSEGVRWIVMKDQLGVSTAQLNDFKKIFRTNARSPQAIGARTVELATKE